MKTIGMIGGSGWVSTLEYYRIINKEVNKRLKDLNFAKCILYSLNYGEINNFNLKNDDNGVYNLLFDASEKIIKAGADCILLCANTLHLHAAKLENNISVPLIHIADSAAVEIKRKNLSKIGLLGTKTTMEKDFYKNKFNDKNIDVIIPGSEEREFINHTIFNELLKDIFEISSKNKFLEIIGELKSRGAEGIVLGCTEIPLLISQEDVDIPLIDTLYYHSVAAVEFALDV